jgi:hypothetical protein
LPGVEVSRLCGVREPELVRASSELTSRHDRTHSLACRMPLDNHVGGRERRSRVEQRAGAEIEHQVVTLNLRSANELRRELATSKEVPPATARVRLDGHGRPPCA